MSEERNDRIRHSWNENAGAWTEAVRTGALESRRLVTDGAVLHAVLDTGARRILDIGCGEGWLARELVAAGCDVVAFDGSSGLIERAQGDSDASFLVLDYAAFAAAPERVGRDFDAAVCNFSLLSDEIAPLLLASRLITRPGGHLLIQTVHPFSAVADGPYEDGWREETFDGLGGTWEPMPWYFRTVGSWIRELASAGWLVRAVTEPLHATGRPASLILTCVGRH